MPDDIVILASDGINVLSDGHIREIIDRCQHKKSDCIADELMKAVRQLDVPDQDNISLVVVKMNVAHDSEQNAPEAEGEDFSTVDHGPSQKLSFLSRLFFKQNSPEVRS